jgi:6-pyruvoyltetrahydropterin/6-carboxytetrahydropterin synthase
MNVRTAIDFTFAAAVRLPGDAGPKKRMHGHNYRLRVIVEGEPDEAALRAAVRAHALERCDHHTLNDFIPEPTPGSVARWFWSELSAKVPGLVEVALWQTPDLCVRVGG